MSKHQSNLISIDDIVSISISPKAPKLISPLQPPCPSLPGYSSPLPFHPHFLTRKASKSLLCKLLNDFLAVTLSFD